MLEDPKHPSLIKEILKRSLVVESCSGHHNFTLFCRTPEKLGVMVEWLAMKFPDKFPDAQSIVADLNILGDMSMKAIKEDPYFYEVYQRVQTRLDVMQVSLPSREGRTRHARRQNESCTRPAENIFLFGIPLPNDDLCGAHNSIFDTLKEFKLAECNIARIGAYDPSEKIILDRLLAQDNLRAKS